MSEYGCVMTFPETVEEFMEDFKIVDTEQVYTNGTELVPIFRMEQWFDAHPQRKRGKWVLDENPHDGDCRCSACGVAIWQMHESNHGLLNALTNGKWWTFYHFCPNCGAEMRGEADEID